MQEKTYAKVVEKLIDRYILITDNNKKIDALLKGNIKKKKEILGGDIVEVEKAYDKFLITDIKERKNSFIRPPVANIDNLVIVVSLKNPVPDYMLLDKELILCNAKNITPIICINKLDLIKDDNEEIEYVKKTYNTEAEIIFTSAYNGNGINELFYKLKGKVSAFSGNSGVGKSSITKKLLDLVKKEENIEIGNIGKKSNRGKHTTKAVKLYEITNSTYILDTPGFSSFELYDINYKNLKDYYKIFKNLNCEYEDCMHINEKEDVCAVKKAVALGKIDKLRYERYVYLYNKLKEIDDKKYK